MNNKEREIAKAEAVIKKILLDLYNKHGIRADAVTVDTRNWTYGAVDIFVEDGK